MKNIILASVFAVTAVTTIDAQAASTSNICSGAAIAGNGAAVVGDSSATNSFVKVGFTPKCSANVFMSANDENSLLFRVGSASGKGKAYFGGSSAGGAVTRMGECSGVCDGSKANAGITAAPSS